MLNILVCIKRVPAPGTRIVLTEDQRAISTRHLGFAISPHEECAVEEAIQLAERHGGHVTVLTLGPAEAEEQLRGALAMGAHRAILMPTQGQEWGPMETAHAIATAIRSKMTTGEPFDLLLFGNEAADSGDYQVGVRVAYALDLPCVSGIKGLEIRDGEAMARREASGGWETYQVTLPAVFTIKEGINLPRYPPLRGRLRAKKADIESIDPQPSSGGLEMVRMQNPPEAGSHVEILGQGPSTAPRIAAILQELGLVST